MRQHTGFLGPIGVLDIFRHIEGGKVIYRHRGGFPVRFWPWRREDMDDEEAAAERERRIQEAEFLSATSVQERVK